MVGLTIFGRMADGVFAGREDAVDKMFVGRFIRQVELHGVNHIHDCMPPVAPTLYRRVLALIGTPDESIEQMVGADDSFLDGPDAHTHIITLRAAGLIHPRLEVVERGAVQLVIKVGFHPLPIGHQMFCPHKVLEARLIDVEQTRLGIGLHLPADKPRDVLRRDRYRPHEDDGQDDQLFHTLHQMVQLANSFFFSHLSIVSSALSISRS